jgi:hypothetical protein
MAYTMEVSGDLENLPNGAVKIPYTLKKDGAEIRSGTTGLMYVPTSKLDDRGVLLTQDERVDDIKRQFADWARSEIDKVAVAELDRSKLATVMNGLVVTR